MKRNATGSAGRVRRKPRILVIEDDLPTRQALEVLLSSDGQEVRAAENGFEALLMLEKYAPDVVVMDWRLPGLGGAQLCRRITRRRDAPPVIILSSADEAFETKTDAAERLRKPVDVRQLNAAIAAQLQIAALSRGRGR